MREPQPGRVSSCPPASERDERGPVLLWCTALVMTAGAVELRRRRAAAAAVHPAWRDGR